MRELGRNLNHSNVIRGVFPARLGRGQKVRQHFLAPDPPADYAEGGLAVNATQSLERWLPVSGYQDFYEVSDLGRVRSVDRIIPNVGRGFAPAFRRGKIRKLQAAEYGHLQLKLSRYGLQEKCWVHRLVLEAFVGPRPDGMVCCHRDGNPTNNHAENLYWGTPSQNNFDQVRHGTHTHAKKTWCVNGHEFNGANTIHRSNGGRDCRACQRDRNRELMRAKRARLREVS